MLFDVSDAPEEDAVLTISYLTRGMTWAPSYHVRIDDDDKLNVELKAVIKNELIDIENVEVKLISGFPNIEFAHVDSPMSQRVSLAHFFPQNATA